MSGFIDWATLGTFGGTLAMVMLLTQFTKDLSLTKKIPTQIWSYILALTVIIPAQVFTNGLTPNGVIEALFNGIIISMASNGSYAAILRMKG